MALPHEHTGPAGDASPVPSGGPVEREWLPPFTLDLHGVLSPLRRGRGDPTWRAESSAGGTSIGAAADGAAIWRVCTTPVGPATVALRRRGDGTVLASGWGPGAAWEIDGLPALLGAEDDPSTFTAHHPLVADARRRMPGLRLGSTRRVWDTLLPAILEQKVTGTEAHRSFRELCRRFGAPPPGPEGVVPAGMRVPPTPARIRAVPEWEWHRAGVDHARRRAILHCAVVAHRLERAAELRGEPGRQLLRRVPGIGVWTAAEVAQRVWGDPDAVSFGDFHVPNTVGHALLGHGLDDVGLLEVLAPYAPQRQRAVRYIEASGFRRPRFGPRFSPRDYRDL